jgi:hypothetical protein
MSQMEVETGRKESNIGLATEAGNRLVRSSLLLL